MEKPTPVPDADAFLIDTHGFGMDQYCGVFVLRGEQGVALVETGPSTTFETVMAGLDALDVSRGEVTHVLPTHVHLDHVGALWKLLEACPNATAVVHARGAPFLTDEQMVGKLLTSVERAVGERFPLYGTFEPIDGARVIEVGGGERVEAAGRALRIVDAPGHAPHQYVVHDEDHACLYAGDAVGIRTPGGPLLMTTPPPRFDLDAWRETLDHFEALEPDWLLLPHFGWVDADAHLGPFREAMEAWVDEIVRHRDQGSTLEETTRAMMLAHTEGRAVYDEAAFKEEIEMNTAGVWLWLERGA